MTTVEMALPLPVFDWKREKRAYTMKMTATRFHTLNSILVRPVASVAVYSLAKNVSVEPFWWKAIQKKMTTAKTRQRATTRSFVSLGVSSGSWWAAAASGVFEL